MVAITLVVALGGGVFAGGAKAADLGPKTYQESAVETPTPRPTRPQINPVSPNDDAVVRPDDTRSGTAVDGLPDTGIGYAAPANENLRRWTSGAEIAIALNGAILVGIALWSFRRHRIQER